jgi:hypothetical protein
MITLVISIFLAGCSSDYFQSLSELSPSPPWSGALPQQKVKAEVKKYFYPYTQKRDPFTALIGNTSRDSTSSEDLSIHELPNLELKGILRDRKGKMAMITSRDGGTFLLRAGKIYDRKNRVIPGISGMIKEKSVILISKDQQDQKVTELNLKNIDETKTSLKSQ